MGTLDELDAGDGEPGETAAIVTEAGGKPRRRSIFGRVTEAPEATEEPRPIRVVVAQNVFGRVTKELHVADPEAAVHWDIRCWWPLH